jgi:hypothetical protein
MHIDGPGTARDQSALNLTNFFSQTKKYTVPVMNEIQYARRGLVNQQNCDNHP